MKKIVEILNSISKDKFIHAECGEIIAIVATLIASIWVYPCAAPLMGFTAACFAALAKELADKYILNGNVDSLDALATVYGAAKPTIVAYSIILIL